MSTLRKTVLLAGVGLAMAAIAAPAGAQANGPFWYIDDEDNSETLVGGMSEKETFVAHGNLEFDFGGLVNASCGVDVHGYVWNGSAAGEGEIDGAQFTPPCSTPSECEIEKIDSTEPIVEPWHVFLTEKDGIDIEEVTFTLTFSNSQSCKKLNLTELSVAGTITGTFPAGESCIEYGNSGDLTTEGEEPFEVALTGTLCTTAGKGGRLTVHF